MKEAKRGTVNGGIVGITKTQRSVEIQAFWVRVFLLAFFKSYYLSRNFKELLSFFKAGPTFGFSPGLPSLWISCIKEEFLLEVLGVDHFYLFVVSFYGLSKRGPCQLVSDLPGALEPVCSIARTRSYLLDSSVSALFIISHSLSQPWTSVT